MFDDQIGWVVEQSAGIMKILTLYFAVYMEISPDRVTDNNGSANEKVHESQVPDQTVADCPQRLPQDYDGYGCQVTNYAENGAANQKGSTPRVLHQHPTGSSY